MQLGKITTLLTAGAAGVVVGSGASALVSKIPMVNTLPMVNLAAGALAGYTIGKKVGGKNGGLAGAVSYLVVSGALGQLNLGGLMPATA